MTVYASDPGGSASFTFHLTSTQFTIDSSTGVVTVAASPSPALDREVSTKIKQKTTKFNIHQIAKEMDHCKKRFWRQGRIGKEGKGEGTIWGGEIVDVPF